MKHTSEIRAEGVSPIIPTPFDDQGQVDVASLHRLVDYLKSIGVSGISILGFMGENDKLSNAERELVTRTTVEQAASEIDVWVGIRTLGTAAAVEDAVVAENHGANAVFVAPSIIQNDAAIYFHYKSVFDAVSIPVMIHDYPPAFQVNLSAELIAHLANDGICPYIKLEDTPIGPKMEKIQALSADSIGIFGGLGAFYFIEELERGSRGIMTGFAFPEVLVKIFEQFRRGDQESAATTFNQYAGLIRYEFQPGIGLALRKHAYHKRGIFSSPHIRHPRGPQLSTYDIMEYERVIARAGLNLAKIS